jgi:hypothetical protein
MQGNALIRLVGYVLAQGSLSVQMTVRDDADERVWWGGMPRRRGSLAWAPVRQAASAWTGGPTAFPPFLNCRLTQGMHDIIGPPLWQLRERAQGEW